MRVFGLLLPVLLLLTACKLPPSGVPPEREPAPEWNVRAIGITVPETLTVSEADAYYPLADIVWRGEPLGERHMQVARIFEEAGQRASSGMKQGEPVKMEVEVTRFHSLTEKTRARIDGVHSLHFIYTLRDFKSGEIIDGPWKLNADIKATGGAQALRDDVEGRTMKVVITEHLAQVLRSQLERQPERADESLIGKVVPWNRPPRSTP